MKLLKFGTVSETADGNLLFDGFDIDCEGASLRADITVLEIVIARCNALLEKIRLEHYDKIKESA